MIVSKAAVVGAGTMGGEIAQAIAAADIDVVLKDIKQEFVDQGIEKAEQVTRSQLDRLVKKEKLTSEQADAQLAEVIGRIHGTTDYSEFGDVDFVIEAAPEKMEIKQQVFAEIDSVTPGHAILSSNTSGLSITEMADATLRPEKVVGFHFFYPASVMPLLEIVEGEETSQETTTAALNFAMEIKKQPIVCDEVPGFVVNRILNASIAEIWREQEENGLSIKKIDEGLAGANATPMGPFTLTDFLGLDTVVHVAENMRESYGDRFYVHGGMSDLVDAGKLGAKTGGEGSYTDGEPNIAGDADPDIEGLVEKFTMKALIEACLLLEEGVCTVREIDLGMMAGAGLDPRRGLFPPFWKADIDGLDNALEKIENLAEQHPDRFSVPRILKRLVAQGRTGIASGQGFYAYPLSDAEHMDTLRIERPEEGVAVVWLANPPMNALSPQVIGDLTTAWGRLRDAGDVRAVIFASSMPVVFCAGADIKAFTKLDQDSGAELINGAHSLLREFEQSGIVTIAAVNSLAFGGGCELAMSADMRIAAQSAVFGQPEVNLGIIPGFGGTQRLPRLVGEQKALEMNLSGDSITAGEAYEYGLVNMLVPDQELMDTARAWARKFAAQAPIAVEQIKQVSAKGDMEEGMEAEKQGFQKAFFSEDAKEGISAFLGKRSPEWKGK